jgi:V-type H+-transporting ATPase subunit E
MGDRTEDAQIQSMINFIDREAEEKVEEINAAAQEEYDVEKMRLVEAEKAKIRANTEKKKKQVEIERRVQRAGHTKVQRQRVMEERAVILTNLKDLIKKKLLSLVGDQTRYRQLLVDLTRQGLLSIQCDVEAHVRQQDEQVLQKAIPDLQQWYERQTGRPVRVTISKEFLHDEESWGGVLLNSEDGRIVCNNTLSYRAATCFEEQLPTVRYMMFSEEAQI